MTNYTKTTDFAAKDSLPSGNAAKIVKGSEIDTEFNNIATASATKANANDAVLTGTTTAQTLDISGNVDVDGTLETDALSLNGVTVTSTAAELNILDGVTATATEINLLDGVTATTAELNYVDGVTSAIQTQIDTKAPLASPTFTGTVTVPGLTTTANVLFGDNDKAIFGAGSDLQIYHDGSNSFIKDAGTGILFVQGSGGVRVLGADTSENLARFNENGSVQLYYNNAEKLATTSTGIDVTGTVVSDGLTVEKTSSGANVSVASLQNDGSGANTKADLDFHAANTKYATISGGYGASAPELDIKVGNTPSKIVTFTDGGDVSFYEDTGTTPKMFWDASTERLGLGTSSPSHQLEIESSSDADLLQVQSTAGSNDTALRLGISGDVATINATGGSTGILALKTYGTERVRVDASGDLTVKGGRIFVNENDNENTAVAITRDADEGYVNLYSSGTQTVEIRGNGTSYINGGDVGIGTTSAYGTNVLNVNGGIAIDGRNASTPGLCEKGDVDTGIFWPAANSLSVSTGGTERMRIDSSGNLLVGKTSTAFGTEGLVYQAGAALEVTTDSNRVVRLNRTTNDGNILEFNKDGSTVGSIGTNGGDLFVGTGDTNILFADGSDALVPANTGGASRDNAIDLGTSGARFDDIFATNGTIQTSDRNEKQDIEALSDAEQRVAAAAKGLLRKFRWKSSVAENGDDARIHFGIIAQDLQAAFEAEGLDAGRYAMFINSTWTDEETGEERTRMGVRYSELLAFIIAAI